MYSPPLHILQKVCWSTKTLKGAVLTGSVRCEDDVLYGLAGDVVVLDGIFGAFFDGYWTRYTGIADLSLIFNLTGQVEIDITRIFSSTGERELIVRSCSRGLGDRVVVPIPLTRGKESRLCLSIAFTTAGSICAPAWTTGTPPMRTVGLTALICTFNRERDVAATLAELLGKNSPLRQILVVNQGEPGLTARLPTDGPGCGPDILRIIDQPNLGGAGGFGRGMLETLGDDGCTHVLLMDDDIDLDAAIVTRLIAVLSYATSDYVIGGAMLDRAARTRLFSVGDVLHDKKPEIRNLVDPSTNDITEDATSRYLAINHRPDFNGWWFCAFPKNEIAKAGLPLPMFIRGDDVEYGFRLTTSGTRTLAWPGLAIWHEPFHTKRHPWHYFYDQRNSLFLCEMHGRFGRFRLAGMLVTGFLNHLLRFDYDRASCITRGLKAFNDGAETLEHWNGDDHARLATTFGSKERRMEKVETPKPIGVSSIPIPFLFAARLARDLVLRPPSKGQPVVIAARDWRPIMRRRPSYVRVHYDDSKSELDLRHDRRRTRMCSQLFIGQILRFLVRRWRPERLVHLTGRDFWSRYTAQPPRRS